MKNMLVVSVVVAIAITAMGCCSLCKTHGNGGGKHGACGMTKNGMTCPRCGMTQGHCKCPGKAAAMAEINTKALKTLIDSGSTVTLVDARTGKYDDGRRIPNALNLSPEAKDEDIQSALTSKDALIVSYCVNMNCQASRQLAARLDALGYKHVLEYPQGIEGWVGEGNAVTQASK